MPFKIAAAERKQIGDWSAVSGRLNEEIAVKAQNQKTVFGILIKFADDEITLQTTNNGLSKIAFKREEIEKIWLAKLKGGRNTGKGALIGAGTGAAVGLIYIIANRQSADGQLSLALPAMAIYGAGIGAGIGFFARQKNRKKQLIYQR
ncbi:MAG: hypothetical protein M3209_11295 [Acidobacteriota bacterium]|nr:hypothetical protein [Acidobacteriota bacterium]